MTTPSMQFQFDVVPALVGVSIYVFCQILFRFLVPHTKKVQDWKASIKEASEPNEADCTLEHLDLQEEDEPVPEPEVELEAPPARTSKRMLAFRFLALLLILGRIMLPIGSYWSSGGLQRPELPVEEPELPVEVPALPVEVLGSSIPEPPFEDTKPSSEDCAPSSSPARVGSNDPAFSVALVRHASDEDEDYVRSAYYGTLKLGTPGIEMTFVFDTGSGHLVAPSYYCHSRTCKAHKRYRRTASSSARDITVGGENWTSGPRECATITFGTGQITGVYVEDVVCMGVQGDASARDNASRPECMTLRFLAATEMSQDPFEIFPFDGIMGLGLSALSQTARFNFMDVLAESLNHVDSRTRHTFGIFLANSDHEQSEIAFGGYAEAHLREELSWSPIHMPEMGHWVIPIRAIRVGDERLDFCDDGGCMGAVDTGTSLVALPTAAFRELYFLLKHRPRQAGHCQGFGPLLHFELEEFTVTLGPKDYSSVRTTTSNWSPNSGLFEGETNKRDRMDLTCMPMLMTLDMEPPLGPKLFILGEPVLRKYYSVFDGRRLQVGFGKARHTKVATRDELLARVPEIEPVSRQRMPTMFDIFRWRKALL